MQSKRNFIKRNQKKPALDLMRLQAGLMFLICLSEVYYSVIVFLISEYR